MHPLTSELRDYVVIKDKDEFNNVSEFFVIIDIIHSNFDKVWRDLRLPLNESVSVIKQLIYKRTGTLEENMELYLQRGNTQNDSLHIYDENLTLRDYNVNHGDVIFVKDIDAHSISAGKCLENLSLVKKYEMDEETYDKREGTLRSYIKGQRGKDPNFRLSFKTPKGDFKPNRWISSEQRPRTPDNAKGIYKTGERCEVNPGGRRGVIAYFGPIGEKNGSFVGVRLDTPEGTGSGLGPDGKEYFQSEKCYGVFSRPENVNVGKEFKEIDYTADSDDEI